MSHRLTSLLTTLDAHMRSRLVDLECFVCCVTFRQDIKSFTEASLISLVALLAVFVLSLSMIDRLSSSSTNEAVTASLQIPTVSAISQTVRLSQRAASRQSRSWTSTKFEIRVSTVYQDSLPRLSCSSWTNYLSSVLLPSWLCQRRFDAEFSSFAIEAKRWRKCRPTPTV